MTKQWGEGKSLQKSRRERFYIWHATYSPKKQLRATLESPKRLFTTLLRLEIGAHVKKTGRPRILSRTCIRSLLRHVSTGKFIAREISKDISITVDVRRVQKLLHISDNIVYENMKAVPMMTENHKKLRYQWDSEKITWKNIHSGKELYFQTRNGFFWMVQMDLLTTGMIYLRNQGFSQSVKKVEINWWSARSVFIVANHIYV